MYVKEIYTYLSLLVIANIAIHCYFKHFITVEFAVFCENLLLDQVRLVRWTFQAWQVNGIQESSCVLTW